MARDAAQPVDGDQLAIVLVVPECPAIAGLEVLQKRADLVDRTCDIAAGKRAISTHLRAPATTRIIKLCARLQQTSVDEADKCDAWLGTLSGQHLKRLHLKRL